MEKRRLGRGLEALFGSEGEAPAAAAGPATAVDEVALDRIQQNPFQPRKHFDGEELASLRDSVRNHGILQPLVVRSVGEGYQLIAGERRLRAAQEAGLSSVPVRVVDFNDQQVLEAALVENIQRSDLNPIEKAQGFKDYLERFELGHEQLAQRLGLARSTITNLVNLLELAPEVQDGIRLGQISEAHAKLLKGIKNRDRQVVLFRQIVALGLSVKATEGLIRESRDGGAEPERTEREGQGEENGHATVGEEKTAHVRGLEDELRQRLATRLEIRLRGKDKGQIVIQFDSNDDFERILEILRR